MKSTKSREFVIDTESLEIEYAYLLEANMLEEYVLEALEIPQEYLASCKVTHEKLNIKLSHGRHYFNDDWYVNLQRVS